MYWHTYTCLQLCTCVINFFLLAVEGNPYTMNNGRKLERTMSVKLRPPAGRVIKSQERTGIKRVSYNCLINFSVVIIVCTCIQTPYM